MLRSGLEVIKLEYILRRKMKRNDWLLAVRKQPIIALYFASENELKFYNLEARSSNFLSNLMRVVNCVRFCQKYFCREFRIWRMFTSRQKRLR